MPWKRPAVRRIAYTNRLHEPLSESIKLVLREE
ncbi:hypothetical protein A2U01_0087696, partial [Trifolium medium]|nr:hypothetical protein [Trifolium medium]